MTGTGRRWKRVAPAAVPPAITPRSAPGIRINPDRALEREFTRDLAGEKLSTALPRAPDDVNELPNPPVIID